MLCTTSSKQAASVAPQTVRMLDCDRIVTISDRGGPLHDISSECELSDRPLRATARLSSRLTLSPIPVVPLPHTARYLTVGHRWAVSAARRQCMQQVPCVEVGLSVIDAVGLTLDEIVDDPWYRTRASRARELLRYMLWVQRQARVMIGGQAYRCDELLDHLLGLDKQLTLRARVCEITGYSPRALRARGDEIRRTNQSLDPARPSDRIHILDAVPIVAPAFDIRTRTRRRTPTQGRLFGGESNG